MSAALFYLAVAGGAFLIAFTVAVIFRFNTAAVGCVVPILAVVATFIWLIVESPQSSAAGLILPFVAIPAFIGSLPGALLGARLRGRA